MDKKLTDAFAAIHKVTTGVAGSSGYAPAGSDEAKALEALLFVFERTVSNIDDIAALARNTPSTDQHAA